MHKRILTLCRQAISEDVVPLYARRLILAMLLTFMTKIIRCSKSLGNEFLQFDLKEPLRESDSVKTINGEISLTAFDCFVIKLKCREGHHISPCSVA